MTSQEMKTMFHDFMNEQIKLEDIKMGKQYKVRLELGMIVEIDVTANNEDDAEKAARDILLDKLCVCGHSGTLFCEVDDPDVYVPSYGISMTDIEEVDYN